MAIDTHGNAECSLVYGSRNETLDENEKEFEARVEEVHEAVR